MALDQKDLELIERLIYKSADDTAVAIARSFERIEERFDATESRLLMRMSELEDKMEASKQETADRLDEIAVQV